jgi:DNA-binding response OmpR family regulator
MPGDEAANDGAGPVRVLVVEDDEDTAESTRRLLLRYGAHAEVSNTAADALARAGRLRPELALVDLRLPDLDGFDLVERLRERLADAIPFCVAVSGTPNLTREPLGRPELFDRYLLKPVEPALLRDLVDATRKKRKGGARVSP